MDNVLAALIFDAVPLEGSIRSQLLRCARLRSPLSVLLPCRQAIVGRSYCRSGGAKRMTVSQASPSAWLARLGCFDHTERDTILDGAGQIGALGFDSNGSIGEQAADAGMRLVADSLQLCTNT
jgi:hypothetical protein